MRIAVLAFFGLAVSWIALAIWQGRRPGEDAPTRTPDPYDYSRMTSRRPDYDASVCTGFGHASHEQRPYNGNGWRG